MRVTGGKVRCPSCNSITHFHDSCAWCGKPVLGNEPRAPTAEEAARWSADQIMNGKRRKNGAQRHKSTTSTDTGLLYNECLAFIREFQMSDSGFCRTVLARHPSFLDILKEHRALNDGTTDKARVQMQKYRDAHK